MSATEVEIEPASTDDTPAEPNRRSTVRQVLNALGPGVITGASDDDPSGIATYSIAGAKFGFSMLWTAPLFFPLMSAIEYICAKIAMVSGTGLAGVLRQHYPKWLLIFCVSLLFVANTINVGTDIGAIAAAGNLLVPQVSPVILAPVVALLVLAFQFFGSYKIISTVFKVFTLSLFSYFLCAFFVHCDLEEIVNYTIFPQIQFKFESLMMLVALLGTTISPYCFFWQASQEVEEEMKIGRLNQADRLGATDSELRNAAFDVDFGMLVSVLVMYFIMLTTGATLHNAGVFQIDTAAEAALALRPLAGDAASLIFALGILGTGFLAIPVLTDSAAYAVAEACGVEPSLSETPSQDRLFYLVIGISTVIGTAINFIGINAMKALLFTAVINGLLAPPLLFVIMRIANNKEIMGARVNGRLTNILGWLTVALMSLASVLFLGSALMNLASGQPLA